MNESEHAWRRLGSALRQERERQGLSQAALAERAGVSVGSVKNAEAGAVPKSRRPYTLTRIEQALSWPAGTVDAILSGQPTPDPAETSPSPRGDLDEARKGLYGALKFGWICKQLGAPSAQLDAFEAAAQALFAATVQTHPERSDAPK
ncbi:helix-turn-helix domain-containing protein [Streptomyces sp. QH1-20]|uniref:helix-turn-helix domain-containing protein n=1 Tax=Streptomyces sp. QH1-20 TaxID=3240934 RepID=UPI00351886A0